MRPAPRGHLSSEVGATELAFAALVALLGLHTVLDAFLAPEPGTAWSDHVGSGGATLLMLAAAATVFSRLPAGGRAALALVLGALALEGAALAVADTRSAGVRGDDWTGFLLAPAGAATVVTGALLLWRSRKLTGHRWIRRAALAGVAALAGLWLVVPTAVAVFATHRPREARAAVDLGRPSTAVTVGTRDGLELHGRYVASRNGAAVVVFPGRRVGRRRHASWRHTATAC